MKQFKFLQWEMYNDSQVLFSAILSFVRTLPQEHRFDIGNQIIRSALSVPLNIAEGSGKQSDKELNRFLEISLGSLYETLAAADTMRRNAFITEKDFENLHDKIAHVCNQIGGFKKQLKAS